MAGHDDAAEQAEHTLDEAEAARRGAERARDLATQAAGRAAREADSAARDADSAARDADAAADSADTGAGDDLRTELLVAERRPSDHPEQFGRPGNPLRRSSPFYLGFVGAIGVLVAYNLVNALASARSVLVLLVVSLFLAVGLNPAVEWILHRGVRRVWAVATVFLMVIIAFVGFGAAVVPPLVEQVAGLVDAAPRWLDDLTANATIRDLDARFGVVDRLQVALTNASLGGQLVGGIVGAGKLVAGTLISSLTVLVLTLYFLASLPAMKHGAYRLVPASRRERVTLLTDEILMRIGGYVAGQILVGAAAGVGTFLFLQVLEAVTDAPTIGDFDVALAILAGFLSLVPLIGATIAAVIITLVGFTDGVAVGIACLTYYVAYQQVENYVIVPRVMMRSVDVPPALTIVAALLGGALLGIVGALIAIPVAAALLLVVREVVIVRQDQA